MKKRLIFIITGLIIIGLLMWAPWITPNYARTKVMSSTSFKEIHPNLPETQVYVPWLPFFRFVTTYERGWFISFLGF